MQIVARWLDTTIKNSSDTMIISSDKKFKIIQTVIYKGQQVGPSQFVVGIWNTDGDSIRFSNMTIIADNTETKVDKAGDYSSKFIVKGNKMTFFTRDKSNNKVFKQDIWKLK